MGLAPGTRLGPYDITAKLGEGGMGEVYRARDARLNRDVAIKVLPEHFSDDAERLARFTREAQTLASINHPNIAHLHGLEEQEGVRALVMELVEGEDLSAVIERGPMPLAEALPIAKQIAEALEAAHELGIVHRDLKPANVKVRADGTVKVLDFGLAKAMDPMTTSGVDSAAGEVSHRWPCVLPGGAGILFAIKMATNETLDDALIALADPGTGEHRVLVEGGTMPRYLDSGHLVFARAGKLYAVTFDLGSRKVRGAPVPVLDGVATAPMTGAAWYDVSRQGLLAYVAGGKVSEVGGFSWEGPGRPSEVLERLDAGIFGGAIRLSRDFKRTVMQIAGANDKLWLIDLEQMNATRLTSGGGNDGDGIVSPDGRWLLFTSDRAGGGNRFYRVPLGAGAPPEPLFEGEGALHSISYPSRMLGFSLDSAHDGSDAYVMAVAEDGTLVAYQSSESGRDEVYVSRLADLGSRRWVTNDGGEVPLWNRDGSRLFYTSANRVSSAALRSASELRFDAPQAVTGPAAPSEIVGFDVAPDETSVLVGRGADPLMLRRDIRLWPGWGKTLRSVE